jgi:hypothetical protein
LAQEFEDPVRSAVLTAQGNTAAAVKERIDVLERILEEGSGA